MAEDGGKKLAIAKFCTKINLTAELARFIQAKPVVQSEAIVKSLEKAEAATAAGKVALAAKHTVSAVNAASGPCVRGVVHDGPFVHQKPAFQEDNVKTCPALTVTRDMLAGDQAVKFFQCSFAEGSDKTSFKLDRVMEKPSISTNSVLLMWDFPLGAVNVDGARKEAKAGDFCKSSRLEHKKKEAIKPSDVSSSEYFGLKYSPTPSLNPADLFCGTFEKNAKEPTDFVLCSTMVATSPLPVSEQGSAQALAFFRQGTPKVFLFRDDEDTDPAAELTTCMLLSDPSIPVGKMIRDHISSTTVVGANLVIDKFKQKFVEQEACSKFVDGQMGLKILTVIHKLAAVQTFAADTTSIEYANQDGIQASMQVSDLVTVLGLKNVGAGKFIIRLECMVAMSGGKRNKEGRRNPFELRRAVIFVNRTKMFQQLRFFAPNQQISPSIPEITYSKMVTFIKDHGVLADGFDFTLTEIKLIVGTGCTFTESGEAPDEIERLCFDIKPANPCVTHGEKAEHTRMAMEKAERSGAETSQIALLAGVAATRLMYDMCDLKEVPSFFTMDAYDVSQPFLVDADQRRALIELGMGQVKISRAQQFMVLNGLDVAQNPYARNEVFIAWICAHAVLCCEESSMIKGFIEGIVPSGTEAETRYAWVWEVSCFVGCLVRALDTLVFSRLKAEDRKTRVHNYVSGAPLLDWLSREVRRDVEQKMNFRKLPDSHVVKFDTAYFLRLWDMGHRFMEFGSTSTYQKLVGDTPDVIDTARTQELVDYFVRYWGRDEFVEAREDA